MSETWTIALCVEIRFPSQNVRGKSWRAKILEKYIKLLMKYDACYFVYIVFFLNEYNSANFSPNFGTDDCFFVEYWMKEMTGN